MRMPEPLELATTWLQGGQIIHKPAGEDLAVGFDWAAALVKTDSAIASSRWSVASRDIGLRVEDETVEGTSTIARLTGGTVGQQYVLTNRVETTSRPAATIDRAVVVLVAITRTREQGRDH